MKITLLYATFYQIFWIFYAWIHLCKLIGIYNEAFSVTKVPIEFSIILYELGISKKLTVIPFFTLSAWKINEILPSFSFSNILHSTCAINAYP